MENLFLVHQASGKMFSLSLEQENIIERGGNDKEYPGRILLADLTVSRPHAKIYWDKQTNQMMIQNLSLRNGTFLNQKRMEEPQTLKHGDHIVIGNNELVFYENFLGGETQEVRATPEKVVTPSRFPSQYVVYGFGAVCVAFLLFLLSFSFSLGPKKDKARELVPAELLPTSVNTAQATSQEGKEPSVTKTESHPEGKAPVVSKTPSLDEPIDSSLPVNPNKETAYFLVVESRKNTPTESNPNQAKEIIPGFSCFGYVDAKNKISLESVSDGKVEQIRAEVGAFVDKGQPLVQLDLIQAKQEMELRNQEQQILQKDLAQNQTELAAAQKRLTETQNLYNKNLESRKKLEEIEALYASLQSRKESTEKKLQLVQLQLQQGKHQIQEGSQLVSPTKAIVLAKLSQVGENVKAKSPLLLLAGIEDRVALLTVSPSEGMEFFEGQKVIVALQSNPSKRYRALVSKIIPEEGGSTLIEANFLNADESILPKVPIIAKFLPKKK